MTDEAELSLIENLQRKSLAPIEEAMAFQALLDAGATQESLASRLGVSRSLIAQRVRLLTLPREAAIALGQGWIGEAAARQVKRLSVIDDVASRPAPEAYESWANHFAHVVLWHSVCCLRGEATESAVSVAVDEVLMQMWVARHVYGSLSAEDAEESALATARDETANYFDRRVAMMQVELRPDWEQLSDTQLADVENAATRWLTRHETEEGGEV
jgi:hypothetical protein